MSRPRSSASRLSRSCTAAFSAEAMAISRPLGFRVSDGRRSGVAAGAGAAGEAAASSAEAAAISLPDGRRVSDGRRSGVALASELARERFSANSNWICFFFASRSCCCAEITSFFAASEASAKLSSRSMAEGVRCILAMLRACAREFLGVHE